MLVFQIQVLSKQFLGHISIDLDIVPKRKIHFQVPPVVEIKLSAYLTHPPEQDCNEIPHQN